MLQQKNIYLKDADKHQKQQSCEEQRQIRKRSQNATIR